MAKMAETMRFNARVETILSADLEILVVVWFDGNTYPHKDEIKAIGGYRYDIHATYYGKSWNKIINLSDLRVEIEKAVEIGAEVGFSEDELLSSHNYKVAKMVAEHDKALLNGRSRS